MGDVSKSENNKKNPKETVKKLLEQLDAPRAVLFHDQYGEPHIAYDGSGGQVVKLGSSSFADRLAHSHWQNTQEMISPQAIQKLIGVLKGYARYEGKRHVLDIRVSRWSNSIWYDLGGGRAVHIEKDDWSVVDRPPIVFKQLPHQLKQVIPDEAGDISLLKSFINVSGSDWLLFVVNLVSTFIPGFPHPLLILHGPQGAGKTTPMRVMMSLIDPSQLEGVPLPENVREFVQVADQHAFLFFDNVSGISTKVSDALARASTGGSFSTRGLYTNNDRVVYQIQKPIALNGINQVVMKPDLLDRSILIKMQRLSPQERDTEKDFWTAFNGQKSQILGGIFTVLSKALANYGKFEIDQLPRMADFTRWGCAIAEACGYTPDEFLAAYQDNIKLQNDEAIEASPVAKAVIELMKDTGRWEGKPTELLKALNSIAFPLGLTSRSWPTDPVWMTRRLNEVQANLGAHNIHVEHRTVNESRMTILTKNASDTKTVKTVSS